MTKGILWIVVGVVMVIFDLTVNPVFSIPINETFSFPIAALAILYGVLAIISTRIAMGQADLSQIEVSEWGTALEKATPRIIELSEQQWSSEAIAETIEEEHQIPQDISIKYMYALRSYLKNSSSDANAEARRNAT